MHEVDRHWDRIEDWLEAHAPVVRDELRPGATPAAIRAAQRALGGPALPEDLVASWLRHDGQSRTGPGLWGGRVLLALQDVLASWREWSERTAAGAFRGVCGDPDAGVRGEWFHAGWVPLTYGAAGDHHCVDLDPADGGTPGQIIELWHDQPARPCIAPSFTVFLRRLADGLEAGAYVYSREGHGVLPVEHARLARTMNRHELARARGRTPLHTAIEEGDRRRVQMLIDAGMDVNAAWQRGPTLSWTPLHAAAAAGDLALIAVLLAAGAHPNPRGDTTSPLHTARTADVARALLDAGADLEAADDLGRTPLHRAAETSDDVDLVRTLLDAGASLDTRSHTGRTPPQDAWVDPVRDLLAAALRRHEERG